MSSKVGRRHWEMSSNVGRRHRDKRSVERKSVERTRHKRKSNIWLSMKIIVNIFNIFHFQKYPF
jgi:hypothetical protein